MRGYVVWNYWDHKVLLTTRSHREAEQLCEVARARTPHIEPHWFGIEAIDDLRTVGAYLQQPMAAALLAAGPL